MQNTILLEKTLSDGRKLVVTTDANAAFFSATINGVAVVAKSSIDRRSAVNGAARMAKLDASIVAILGGKIALKADDLATIDAVLAANAAPDRAALRASLARETARTAEYNAFAACLGAGEKHN